MAIAPGCSSQSVLQIQQCNQEQNQFQSTATPTDFVAAHCWLMQNMQIQNTSSESQTPANTTSHVLQHAMQGNGQYGYMQNGQEYNQLWQYYYYQQQQQLQLQQHYIQLQQQSFQQEQSQQQLQHSQMEPLQPQQLQQQVLQQQQYFQQQQPLQQENPVHLKQQQQRSTQSSSHPVADQGQAIETSQGHGAIQSQQSDKPRSVSSPVGHRAQEKSTQEE
ncbi:mediator of RNA polymerase II transcription subunit 12 [Spatholobus suberectus]|nr:mediator of RNA polymerase II transcription subunit 12 [Spatholobus suberectus]